MSTAEANAAAKQEWWRWERECARCLLCPHACLIPPGGKGRCGVRVHTPGTGLKPLNYGLVSSIAVDPVEKKPLYHWKPGTCILSLGSVGCSMYCPFCQNWQIAEWAPSIPLQKLEPDMAAKLAVQEGLSSVAFTYNEPLTWFEYLLDACRFLAGDHISAALVSNGMINPRPLMELVPLLSAANIDLKAFSPETYRFLGGEIHTVKNTIKTLLESGVHVEVTFLLVPGINDEPDVFGKMVAWLASLDPSPVLHISRYFPNRDWKMPATPMERIREYEAIAKERLPWVYTGNTDEESVTRCLQCGGILIRRRRYKVLEINLDEDGRCVFCTSQSPIIL